MILLITAPKGFASALFSYFYTTQLEFYSLKTRNGLSKTNKQIRNLNPNCKNNKWQTTREKLT